jgi:hypothetical protein
MDAEYSSETLAHIYKLHGITIQSTLNLTIYFVNAAHAKCKLIALHQDV